MEVAKMTGDYIVQIAENAFVEKTLHLRELLLGFKPIYTEVR